MNGFNAWKNEESLLEHYKIKNWTSEEIAAIGEEHYNAAKRIDEQYREMEAHPEKYTKEDRINLLGEMSFEHKAFREHWTKEEKQRQKAVFDKWFEEIKEKAGKRISPIFDELNSFAFDLEAELIWDRRANVYRAACESIGLVFESKSYDDLIDRIRTEAPKLIESNGAFRYLGIKIRTGDIYIPIIDEVE